MANTNISGDLYNDYKATITTSTAIQGKSANEMGMDEFFTLLVAQMTNQDMMNPEGNTEFIAQMAQFSALQGVKTIQEYQLSNYAVSYTGKNVTIAHINESTGDLETVSGVVEKVNFYDGSPKVVVNGTSYPLHEVMEVNSNNAAQNEQNAGSALNLVASYIGKTVTVTDASDPANPKDVTGVVSSVTLKGGKPYVIVNGKEYVYTSITSVGEKGKTEETGSTETESTETESTETENPGGEDLDTDD